jgi:hypothetical protein
VEEALLFAEFSKLILSFEHICLMHSQHLSGSEHLTTQRTQRLLRACPHVLRIRTATTAAAATASQSGQRVDGHAGCRQRIGIVCGGDPLLEARATEQVRTGRDARVRHCFAANTARLIGRLLEHGHQPLHFIARVRRQIQETR